MYFTSGFRNDGVICYLCSLCFVNFYRFQQVFTKFCECEASDSQVDVLEAFFTLFSIAVCSMVSVYANFCNEVIMGCDTGF